MCIRDSVSVEQARKNLYAELESWNFEEVKHASFDEWNTWLGKIEVEGGSREQQIKFYTCCLLYTSRNFILRF